MEKREREMKWFRIKATRKRDRDNGREKYTDKSINGKSVTQ